MFGVSCDPLPFSACRTHVFIGESESESPRIGSPWDSWERASPSPSPGSRASSVSAIELEIRRRMGSGMATSKRAVLALPGKGQLEYSSDACPYTGTSVRGIMRRGGGRVY